MTKGNLGERLAVKKRRQWNAREKLMVVFYHENGHSIRETASKYGIEPKQVRYWKNRKSNLMRVAPYIQRLNTGARPKYPQLEEELLEWFRDLRKQLKTVTGYMIGARARSLANKQEYRTLYPDIHRCKFSHKWVDGFMSRHLLVNRRRTTVAQRLPDEYNEEQQNFLSYVLYLRTENSYPLNLIGNMNEILMKFNLPSQTTAEEQTDHKRTHFTVTLTCLADGTKLPPFIIFKLVDVPREQFPDGIHVHANSTGWMDEKEMVWWVKNVWRRRANVSLNQRSLIVLDSFTAHGTEPVKRRFKERNTDIAVIPGGLTSRLQPLDVSLSKVFKAKVRHAYRQWMDEANTPEDEIKRPSYSQVVTWIKEAWNNIDPAMIRRSFKCCGISTEVDGSEDKCIFDFEKVLGKRGVRIGIEEEGEGEESGGDSENGSECEYYENEEGSYANIWG